MLTEELGFAPNDRSPLRAAGVTFCAFVAFGSVPLLVFVGQAMGAIEFAAPFAVSAVMTVLAFFTVGTLKSHFVDQAWWRSGLETLALGGAAAVLAYAVGSALQNV